MATKKSKTEYSEGGRASHPKTDIGKRISDTSAWLRNKCASDDEVLARIAEYRDLCALKEEYPSVENLCLYLGISYVEMREWRSGEKCSKKVKDAIDICFTWILSLDNQRANANEMPYVMRIWGGKQNHGEREPNSKLEDLLAGSLLKELPSASNVAQRYLEDYDESEADDDDSREDS